MKKVFVFLVSVAVLLSLVACGTGQSSGKQNNDEGTASMLSSQTKPSEKSNYDTPTEESKTEPTMDSNDDKADDNVSSTGIRPDFKEAMDAYEAFYDEYCAFMVKYQKNPTDMTLLLEYSNLMTKAVEMDEAFEKWESEDLTNEELKYYLEVNNRVMQKMVDVMG